jgi:hypothetical protein
MWNAGSAWAEALWGPPRNGTVALFGLGCVEQPPFRLPLALDSLGMPGCELHVRADIGVPAALDANGFAQILLPDLPGLWLYSQWAHFDDSANPAGLSWTNAISVLRAPPPPCPMTYVYRTGTVTNPVGFGPSEDGKITRLEYR